MTEDEMVGWHHRLSGHAKGKGKALAQSCPTLCDPMDCGTPGFPVLHYLPEFALTDGKVSACNVGDTGSIPGLGRYPGEGNGTPL